MGVYSIAGLDVSYEPVYAQLRDRSEKYAVSEEAARIRMKIAVSDERIEQLKQTAPNLTIEECEYMLTGSDFYSGLVHFNGMLLHASAVAVDGRAYLFSAPCGTGKSTHTGLWCKYFGEDRAKIINDDKPAIRMLDGKAYVYGTPFSGKYDINENTRVRLGGICFLHQAPENTIVRMSEKEAIYALLNQSLRPAEAENMTKLLATIAAILGDTDIYSMGCNISFDAVKLSHETMRKEEDVT